MAMDEHDIKEIQHQARSFIEETTKEFQSQLQELNREKRQLLTLIFLLSLFNSVLRDERLGLWQKMPKGADKLQEKLLNALQYPEQRFSSHSFLKRINVETASELVRQAIYQKIHSHRHAMGHWNELLEQKSGDKLYMPREDVNLFVKRTEEMRPIVDKRAEWTHRKSDASIKQQLARRVGVNAGGIALGALLTTLVTAGTVAGSVVTCGAVAGAVLAVSAVAFFWYRHKKRKKFNQLDRFFSKKEPVKQNPPAYQSNNIKEMDDALTDAVFNRPNISRDRAHKKLPKSDGGELDIDNLAEFFEPVTDASVSLSMKR